MANKADFKRLAENNQLSHAYLFFGEEKEGQDEKFILAKSLANFLENGIFEEPNDLLKETLLIHPNEKGVIGIDDIRNLRYFLWQKPANSPRRLAIVNGVSGLTPEAQNAALKIVEEPPEDGLIIFIAKTTDDLLPTLTSRTQKIYFPAKTHEDIDKHRKPARENDEGDLNMDEFFKALILNLMKDPIKNSKKLKEALTRLTLMKQFNTNKKLQIRALE